MNQPLKNEGLNASQRIPSHIQGTTDVVAASAAAISTAAAVAAMSGPLNSPVTNVNLNSHLDGKFMICPTPTLPSNANTASVVNTLSRTTQSSNPSIAAHGGISSNTFANISQSSSTNRISTQGIHNTAPPGAYTHPGLNMPQHLHFNPVAAYQPFRQPSRDEKPLMFQNLPLRRGKWTPEEERFAKAIIDAFEKGIIHGCENGCTLRAYLSRKLHCQPMRISKKYAGKSIGKQVFMSRLNVSPGRELAASTHESLKKLESEFLMSVLQEGIANNVDGSANNSGSHLSGTYQPTNTAHLMVNTASHQPASMNTHPAKNSVWPQYKMPMGSVIAPVLPTSMLPQPSQMPVTTLNIHQNLFNAFKQAQTVYANKETSPKENSSSNVVDAGCRDQSINSDNPSSSSTSDGLTTGQAQQNWLNEAMPIILSLDPTPPSLDPTLNDGRYSPTYTSKSFDDLHQLIGKHCPPSETDNKVKSSQAIGPMGPATYAAIKMQDEEASNSKQGCKQKTFLPRTAVNKIESNKKELGFHPNKTADPSESLTFIHAADEYSFFAQQSAIEASKHSAYMRQDASPAASVSNSAPVPLMIASNQVVSATFNAVNLQIHGDNAQTQCEDASNASKFNTPANMHRPMPIVSGSERSSSEFGTDVGGSSSSTRSGWSTSDNDNSDLASEEGRMSADSLQQRKKRKLNSNEGRSHRGKSAKLQN